MPTHLKFYHAFSKRMVLLSVITGLFISLSMPLTFFLLRWSDESRHAELLSQEIKKNIEQTMKENPGQSISSRTLKLTGGISEIELEHISRIELLDLEGRSVLVEEVSSWSMFDIVEKADIQYNNQLIGYIEVSNQIKNTLILTFILLVVFGFSGVIIALLLYQLPARIVKRAEREIELQISKLNDLSYRDNLTGLYNRAYLHEFMPILIEQSQEINGRFAVMFLDIDNFKKVNDSLGHTFGDRLLTMTGERIKTVVRNQDRIFRLGGDEFMIILPDIENQDEVMEIAEKIINLSGQPAYLDGHELYVTTSVGISFYPDDGENMSLLVRNADTAMYAAKARGKNKYSLYEWYMNRVVMDRLNLEHNLRKAIEKEEFSLHYQPKFNLYNQDIVGCEVLLRWQQSVIGLISPDRFIPLAEETGLIIPIGEWVIEAAFRQIKMWVERYKIDFRFSINLSPLQFQHEQLIPMMTRLLHEIQLDPKYIEIEITERVGMDDLESVLSKLHQIKALGFEISIDDFGTGYSSMSYLSKFPIDTLKIAMQFIQNIETDKGNEAIVAAIIAMTHNLQLKVIAEGIESEEQIHMLQSKNCTTGQGFYFCRPIPANEFIEFVLSRDSRKSMLR